METTYRCADVFAGIGGMSLGLQNTGRFEVCFQVELDPFCRGILRYHWPGVLLFSDVKLCRVGMVPRVDVLGCGFPCQDISIMGKRVGLDGKNSGLWYEFLRLIRELRPRVALIENVAGLRFPVGSSAHREERAAALSAILLSLSAEGYDAEWCSLYAFQFGFPHYRERCFIAAYPCSERWSGALFSGIRLCNAPEWDGVSGRLDWVSGSVERIEAGLGESAVLRDNPFIPRRMGSLQALGNSMMPCMVEYVASFVLQGLDAGVV